jgi:hypothetical protein
VEVGREFATMVILTTLAALTRGPFIKKFANFVYVFAIWDITYYAALYLFERWPSSLFEWDVLFLLPVPWYGPVIVPIGLSLCGIIGTLLIHGASEIKGTILLNWKVAAPVLSALAICLISFLNHSNRDSFPEQYDWYLFYAGLALIGWGYAWFIKINFFPAREEKVIEQ